MSLTISWTAAGCGRALTAGARGIGLVLRRRNSTTWAAANGRGVAPTGAVRGGGPGLRERILIPLPTASGCATRECSEVSAEVAGAGLRPREPSRTTLGTSRGRAAVV